MAEPPPRDADELRDDIKALKSIIDAAARNDADASLVTVFSDLLRERREELEALELPGDDSR